MNMALLRHHGICYLIPYENREGPDQTAQMCSLVRALALHILSLADDKLVIFFLTFPEKEGLIFHANCFLRRKFTYNVKPFFLEKALKHFKISYAETFTQHAKH